MERSAFRALKTWKSDPNRKPLVIQGARQVGKTFLVKELGKREYQDCACFNFEETPALSTLFEGDLAPEKIVESLAAYQGRPIRPETTLIFFDEIQASPRALTSLKYFQEQAPKYHVIAAGSLLGVSVGKETSFPVGKVNFLILYPLSFLEFLIALGETALYGLLHEKRDLSSIAELLHGKLTDLLRLFLFLGGMPEVVQEFLNSRDHAAARAVQKDIIRAYERDFSKYTTPAQAVRISEIWRSLPSQLARENKKFKYSAVRKGGRAGQFESAVEWLRSAGLMYTAVNVTAAKPPLAGYEEKTRFKAYVLDCGILGAMVDLPSKAIVSGDKLFSDYNGAFTENFAASELAPKSEGRLHYWVSEGIAEVDFLLTVDGAILPLEVKSGVNRNIKSLRVYEKKYRPSRIYRASLRNFECRDNFVNFPLYALGLFPELR